MGKLPGGWFCFEFCLLATHKQAYPKKSTKEVVLWNGDEISALRCWIYYSVSGVVGKKELRCLCKQLVNAWTKKLKTQKNK